MDRKRNIFSWALGEGVKEVLIITRANSVILVSTLEKVWKCRLWMPKPKRALAF